jgi:hypothetical protein
MANVGKVQLTYIAVAPADLAEEGRRLFESHAKWMKATHHRDGSKALISYNVSTAPEPADIWDESSGSTGRTVFILSEVYESRAGVEDHQRQAGESWSDYPAYVTWLQKCQVNGVSSARIEQSLW